jgi:hypothetical protein
MAQPDKFLLLIIRPPDDFNTTQDAREVELFGREQTIQLQGEIQTILWCFLDSQNNIIDATNVSQAPRFVMNSQHLNYPAGEISTGSVNMSRQIITLENVDGLMKKVISIRTTSLQLENVSNEKQRDDYISILQMEIPDFLDSK